MYRYICILLLYIYNLPALNFVKY